MCLLLYLQLILSAVSVVFDFNDSLNDFAPVAPISLPVVAERMEKGDLLIDFFCVFFFAFTTCIKCSECCV